MWITRASPNIALIKYMGKHDGNVPCNASLSYTLDHLWTEVTLEKNDCLDTFEHDELSSDAIKRFVDHLRYIKQLFGYNGFFTIKSKSNFIHSAGIASSASSFAALTKCAIEAIGANISIKEMSDISKKGSGSSCRSFFSPWCIWNDQCASEANISIRNLRHELIIVDRSVKQVSSSEAHRLVRSSLLFNGRKERAEKRLSELILALNDGRWQDAYEICWAEFMDMHALFATSVPHFGYVNSKTISVLESIERFWKMHKDGPIATIDAGANVHLLWRNDQDQLRSHFDCLIFRGN